MTTVSPLGDRHRPLGGLDPRGPRFAAALTTVVLPPPSSSPHPCCWPSRPWSSRWGLLPPPRVPALRDLFRHLVRPRLGAPEHLEDPASSRFAQACGLAFSIVGLLGFALGAQWLALGAIAFALAAAFLNAAFDFCIGCEIYVRAQRLRRS